MKHVHNTVRFYQAIANLFPRGGTLYYSEFYIYQYMYFIPTLSETYLKIYIIYKGIYPSAYLVRRLISEVLIHYHMFLYFHGKCFCSTFKYMCQFCTYFQVSC